MRGAAALLAQRGMPDRLLADVWAAATGESSGTTRKRLRDDVSEDLGPLFRKVTLPLSETSTLREDGKTTADFVFLQPVLLLQYYLDRVPELTSFLWGLCSSGRGSKDEPLQILFYNDEVTPGNCMDPANSRKFIAFYWSLKEYGGYLLTQELSWLIGGIFLSSLVREVQGGLAAITKVFLREFFVHAALSTAGASLEFGFRRERVFF